MAVLQYVVNETDVFLHFVPAVLFRIHSDLQY